MYTFGKNLENKKFICKNGEIVIIMAVGVLNTWINIYYPKSDSEEFTQVENGYLDIAITAGRLQPYRK